MKLTRTVLFLSLLFTAFAWSQTHVGAKFVPKKTTTNPDSAFFGDIGIRGAWVAPDLDKDGKPEIIVTDYTKTGRIHVFEAAGNDTVEWVWSSPRLDQVAGLPYGAGGGSTPRTIRTGDMDGDGKGEIITSRGGLGGGILIFEWDGVTGSNKYGTIPSAFIPANVPYGANLGTLAGIANEGGLQLTIEHFEVEDVDGDGKQELLLPKNLSGTVNDDFVIISASGEWDFENQGFAAFQIEGTTGRVASTKFGGASPYAIHPADLNGDGKKELVCHMWNFAATWIMKVTAADTYTIPDTTGTTTNGNQFFYPNPATDHVALFGGIVGDLDKDGTDEVYLPLYTDGAPTSGSVFVVDYAKNEVITKIDSAHVVNVGPATSQNASGVGISSFTGVIADLDRNGKKEVLVGSSYPSNVVALEYNGGSTKDPASYTRKVLYKGQDPTVYNVSKRDSVVYRDSLGVKDSTKFALKDSALVNGEGFVSKMTKPVDIDGDGKIEVVLPYQAITENLASATFQRKWTWRSFKYAGTDSAKWVQDSTKTTTDSTKTVPNPATWAFRTLEADVAGSVNESKYTFITPDDYVLNQNFPNPFNPSTTVSFTLPLTKKVTAKVYDMLGKEVRTLLSNEELAKGTHSVVWNGRDNRGRQVASGSYIFRMNAGNVEKNIKMMMVK